MILNHFEAVRFENVMAEGRTCPLILGCRGLGEEIGTIPKLVKAIGCPELYSKTQLIAEVVGNAVARCIGVHTPEPCVVTIDVPICRIINMNLKSLGYSHTIQQGLAPGCELLRPAPAPYTSGQSLTPEMCNHAAYIYVFDMLSQNIDRRPEKVNCGIAKGGIIAFDFEMCFQHLFLWIANKVEAAHWEPSKSVRGQDHLFYNAVRNNPITSQRIEQMIDKLTSNWWNETRDSLPGEWQADAERIGEVILSISSNTHAFAQDILRSLL